MVFIEDDECRCKVVDHGRINITEGVPRLLIKNITFDTNITLTCETSRPTKYVIECNGDDDNDFASMSCANILIVVCLLLIILAVFFYTKWQNGKEIKEIKRNYERQIEELKNPVGNKSDII